MDDTTIKITIEGKLVNLPILRKTIRGICSHFIENEKVFQDIELSLNEAISNVINHAYENQIGQEIEIEVKIYPSEFIFKIMDKGRENTKSVKHNIDPSPDLDLLEEDGRGMFLINELMDEVTYKREKVTNILILRKCYNPAI